MATVGLNVNFTLGSNGSPTTPVDLSTKVSSIDFGREQDLPDVTAFGTTGSRAYAAGLTSGTFKVELFWDATVDAHMNGLIGYQTAVNFVFGPDGSTSGYRKYTGTCFLKSLGEPIKVGEVKKFSMDFQITGAITATTY